MAIKEFLKHKVGIDWAIFYTLLGRGLQMSTAVFTVFFIISNLSPDEQGYYYTFGSIVAIQVFFELGLTGIITQFVAHECSHLRFNENFQLVGDELYRSRISSLLRFCTKWYAVFACVLLLVLVVVGYFFFSKYDATNKPIEWQLPWYLLAVGTAFNLLLSPILAFIEGLGKVKEIAQIRLVQQIVHPVVVWGGLALGGKLFVSGADALLRILVVVVILLKSPFYRILKNIWFDLKVNRISYIKEIFPYQWRIALSWISGYFIFQLFNPVLFATEGTVVAGQMGMTMTALNGLQALTLAWINTKVPVLSGLIAQKKYHDLDCLFNKTLHQILVIGSICILSFVLVMWTIQIYDIGLFGVPIGNRFLDIIPLSLMAWSVWSMFPVNCWATYLRCHKKEPLLLNSVVMGILCSCSTLILGYKYGLYGMTLGFACLRVISLFWIRYIYKVKKKEWHEK